MRQLFIILTIGTFLAGCEKQKELIEKFVFDNSQITHRTVHSYMFDSSSRIKVDRSINYQYMAGVPLDSVVTETIFQYNTEGLLISAIDAPDSSRRVKIYNDLDSLIGDYSINRFGDTTDLAITMYDGNKVIRRINRHLSMRLPESLEKISSRVTIR